MHVQVVEYNSDWRTSFDTEKNEIENILGSNLKAIYHIGSTSVEGLKSKPIIDILLVLEQVEDIDSFNEQFETLGYECMGEFGIAGRRYFRKGGNNRTHQIHAFGENSHHDVVRHIAVRDYLREYPLVAKEYGNLKSELAIKFPESIDEYCDGKDAFVKSLEKDALKWYQSQQ